MFDEPDAATVEPTTVNSMDSITAQGAYRDLLDDADDEAGDDRRLVTDGGVEVDEGDDDDDEQAGERDHEHPDDLARDLTVLDAVTSVEATSSYGVTGTTDEVLVRVDGYATARVLVGGVVERVEQAGYDTAPSTYDSTDGLRVVGTAVRGGDEA